LTEHESGVPASVGYSLASTLTPRQRHLLEKLSDEQLVGRAQAGDAYATEFLLTKFKQLVLQHARPYYLIGGDREDLLQEGMIGLYKAVRDFSCERGHPFQAFAGICIRRQIITAIKAASRLKCLPLNTAQSLETQSAEDGAQDLLETLLEAAERAPEEVWLDQVTTRNIRRLMKRQLSSLEYQSVAMYAAGLSYHEIAERLGYHSRTIDRALFRGKRKVRGILASKEA
jgi:RNA polymerase sporulation-specific sigma factor